MRLGLAKRWERSLHNYWSVQWSRTHLFSLQALITTLSRYSFVVSLVGPCWLAGRRGRTVCLLRPSVACVQRALEPISRRSVDFARVCCRLAVSHRITVLTTLPESAAVSPWVPPASRCFTDFVMNTPLSRSHSADLDGHLFPRPSVQYFRCAFIRSSVRSIYRGWWELTNNPRQNVRKKPS